MGRKKRKSNEEGKENKYEHEFSEELSDGGDRDEYIKKQSPKSCGGL